ncbi:MAG: type I DNA topoisomerase [Gemmataceae bacterium]
MPPRKKKTADQAADAPVAPRQRKTTTTRKKATTAAKNSTAVRRGSRAAVQAVFDGSRKNLVIVESPAKAKTIQKYLGSGYEVAASYGHIRDLPKRPPRGQIGIDIEAGWVPTYVNLDDDTHKRVLNDLKKRAARAGLVYLAPDRDREGEAIAWHLKEALNLSDERVRRVTFNEITKRAIQEAFAHAGEIDMDRVRAQEARRFLDRAVGYKISPLLRKKIGAQSAGRVQSVAVRLIVEREREIAAFKSEEYWKITAWLATEGVLPRSAVAARIRKKQDGADAEETKDELKEGTFSAELAEWAGKKFEAGNEQQAVPIAQALAGAAYHVQRVEQKDRPEKAPPPFTTSTLQQQANIRFGFSAKHTMRLAQDLYEGIDLGSEGAVALITYMRTDSTRIAPEALTACREHIQNQYGDTYLPEKPNYYASGKSAQEAHEAIRPTDLSYTPQRVAPFLNEHQRKLYELIYRRFVACQMKPAIFAVTTVDILAQPQGSELPGPGLFKAQGKVLKFDGYRRVLAPKGKQEDATLPALAEKQNLDLHDLLASQHFTQPPPRYNEASLVKALEKEGIGRPSTYASIISKIQERKYVEQRERRFFPTELGNLATDKLVQHFPEVMDFKFTSSMEEKLDQIEERQAEMVHVLNDFWGPFSMALRSATEEMESIRGAETGELCPQCGKPLVIKFSTKTKGNRFIGCSGYPECKYIKPREGEPLREEPVLTDHPCPNCGKPMLRRMGKRGPFLGCSDYPECKATMNLDAEGNPVPSSRPTEHVCEKCGKPMVIREGPRGPFLACTGYPKCRNAHDVDAQGNPIKPVESGLNCEKCGAAMVVKRGPRGPFLGCSAYPKCRSTKPVPAEMKEKLKDMIPAPAKKAVPAIEVSETCPECESAMKLRPSPRGGYFLGCSKYPRCRGTREVSPEMLEQLETSSA